MSEKTGWFAAEIKPIHIGEYETHNCQWSGSEVAMKAADDGKRKPVMRYWDGTEWRFDADGTPTVFQKRIWRGLTEPSA